MIEIYEHDGKHFTRKIAAELIYKIYMGKPPIDESTLPEQVYQIHTANGGLPPEVRGRKENSSRRQMEIDKYISSRVRSYVRLALSGLHANSCATRKSSRLWYIHEMDIHRDEREYPKTLGKGSQEVYCYYYRTYREIVELKHKDPVWMPYREKSVWKCRVGQTMKQDTSTRVKQQMGVLPEQPTIALIMKTDDSEKLEGMIHNILKFWDRKVPEAQGREWFLTSPDEVERIHDFLQYGYHS